MKMLIVGVSIGLLAGIGYAMPDAKEQKVADAKVRQIMAGFRDQSNAVQAEMALKASESAKTEGERFLLIKGAYLKYIKAGEYDKAAGALDVLQFRVKDVSEAYLRELLDKGLEGLPLGKADRLTAIKKSLDAGIPRVIMTDPVNGALDVSPKKDKITVWFDRPMEKGMSPCGEWPKMLGRPTYDESGKVLTFPVELTPGKSYGMSLNSMSHKNFKSAAGVVMEPYPYAFRVAR